MSNLDSALQTFFNHLGVNVEQSSDVVLHLNPFDLSVLVQVWDEEQGIIRKQLNFYRGKQNDVLNTAVSLFGLKGEFDHLQIAKQSGSIRITESRSIEEQRFAGMLNQICSKTKKGKDLA